MRSPGPGAFSPVGTPDVLASHPAVGSPGSGALSPGVGTSSASHAAPVVAPAGAPAVVCHVPANAVATPPTANDHQMVTRGKHDFRQPKQIFDLQAAVLSPVPKHTVVL